MNTFEWTSKILKGVAKGKRARSTRGIRGSPTLGVGALRCHQVNHQTQEDAQPTLEHMAAALLLGVERMVTLLATGAPVVPSALLPPPGEAFHWYTGY